MTRVSVADVNTPNPDKKSIMMYVMCLFQSLPHSSEDVADMESIHSEPGTPVATQPPEVNAACSLTHLVLRQCPHRISCLFPNYCVLYL